MASFEEIITNINVRNIIIFAIWGIILIVPILRVWAQSDQQVEEIRAIFESTRFPDIANESLINLRNIIASGYWDKLSQIKKEKIVDAFIKQLRHGQRVCRVGESEDAAKYMRYLGEIAGKLKNSRTIPVLIDGLPCGDYEEALAKIGGPAVDLLAKSFTNESTPLFREAVLTAFDKMPEVNTLTEKDREKIKRVIIKACQAKESEVRASAIAVLANYGGEEDAPTLRSLLENDTDFYEVNTPSGAWTGRGKYKRYIEREEANKTLEKIKSKYKSKSQQVSTYTTQENYIP